LDGSDWTQSYFAVVLCAARWTRSGLRYHKATTHMLILFVPNWSLRYDDVYDGCGCVLALFVTQIWAYWRQSGFSEDLAVAFMATSLVTATTYVSSSFLSLYSSHSYHQFSRSFYPLIRVTW
jgi:hypothetical protein